MTSTNHAMLPLTRAFMAANRYLGWGEPQGVWFVGLEEADSQYDRSVDAIIRLYDELGEISPPAANPNFDALGREGRRIRHTTSRILSAVSRRALDVFVADRWRWYHDNVLWTPGSLAFQANLYPLGKPNRAFWPNQFLPVYGFGPGDRDRYVQTVAATRFPRLRDQWLAASPPATICFGKQAWSDFQSVFALPSAPSSTLANGRILVYEKARVILTPFFAYGHVSNNDADAIGALLRKWEISIP